MVRAIHAIRPGTRLGETTRRFASFFGADIPDPFDAEPLDGMETLRRSERVFSSTPVRMEDAALPASYVSTLVGEGAEAAGQIEAIDEWMVTDTAVTLYHEEATLHHETWLQLEYTGTNPELDGTTDSIFCAGALEYGVTADEARQYLDDPGGSRIDPNTTRERVAGSATVEMMDVVLPEPAEPAYVREHTATGAEAAAYLDDRLAGDAYFDDAPVTGLRQYAEEGTARIVAETENGRTVFRLR